MAVFWNRNRLNLMKKPKLFGIAPQLVVKDAVKTAEYYKDVLGFRIIDYFHNPPVYAMVERDGFQIHFAQADTETLNTNEKLRKETTDFVIWVPEIDSFFEELTSKNANIVQEIVSRSYGREFIIQDCNGYKIMVCD